MRRAVAQKLAFHGIGGKILVAFDGYAALALCDHDAVPAGTLHGRAETRADTSAVTPGRGQKVTMACQRRRRLQPESLPDGGREPGLVQRIKVQARRAALQ